MATIALGVSAESLTIHDGAGSNYYVPVNGSFYDTEGTTSQVIYPASDLAVMSNKSIKSITFYTTSGVKFSGGLLQVSVGVTEQTTLSALVTSGLTVVKTFAVEEAENLVINFDTPYDYAGGNLLIECKVISGGTYGFSFFAGETQSTNTGYGGGGPVSFLPKVTFEYEGESLPYSAQVTPNSLDFGTNSLNKYPITLNVKLINNGLNAFTPAISGLSAPFSTSYTPAELAAGANVEIPVTLDPTAVDTYSGTLTIDCGQAGSFQVALAGEATEAVAEVTVADGYSSNGYIPVYGLYYDAQDTKSQMIYAEELLTDLVDKEITGVTFYTTGPLKINNGNMELSMGTTQLSEFTEATDESATPVAHTSAVLGEETIEFVLDEPVTYVGGNLLLGVRTTDGTGTYGSGNYFQGELQNGYVSFYSYQGYFGVTSATTQFLPKTTFSYNDSPAVGVNNVSADRAIKQVRYYNLAGMQSATAFDGVNIIVTEFSDGTKTSTKVIR